MEIADKNREHDRSSAVSYRLNVWNVLGFALCLRILLPTIGYFYTRDVTIFIAPDTASYVEPAHELIASHRFFADGAPEIIRTPGYPLLLTARSAAGSASAYYNCIPNHT